MKNLISLDASGNAVNPTLVNDVLKKRINPSSVQVPLNETGDVVTPDTFDEETKKRMEMARAAGIPEAQIQMEALEYKAKKQLLSTLNVQEQPKEENKWADWLPMLGAIGGSFIPGLGNIVGGALGAMAGTGIKQLAKKEKFNLPEITISGIATAGTGLLFKGIGSLAGKVAGSLEEEGGSLAARSLRMSKTQLANFAKVHGEEVASVLKTHPELIAKSSEEISQYIQPLQESFDAIAKSQGVKVGAKEVSDQAMTVITKLAQSGSTEDNLLAEKILNEVSNIISKKGLDVASQPLSILNAARKEIDKVTGDFMTDSKNKLVGQIIRNSVRTAADNAGLVTAEGKTLQAAGQELSKLYAIQDIAFIQDHLGGGNQLIGITPLLASIFGGGVGGALGGNPLAGGVTTAGLLKIANNPKTVAALSTLLTKSGQTLESLLSKIPQAGVTLGQVGSEAIGASLPSILSSGTPTVQGEEATGLPTIGETQGTQMGQEQGLGAGKLTSTNYITGYSPEQLFKAAMEAQMAGDKKSYTTLKGWYDIETAYKKGTGKEPAQVSDLKASLDMMTMLEPTLDSYKDVLGPIGGKLKSLNPYDTRAQDFKSQMMAVAQVVGRAMEGGVLRQEDVSKYRAILPQITDTLAVVKRKIQNVKKILNQQISSRSNQAVESLPAITQTDYATE